MSEENLEPHEDVVCIFLRALWTCRVPLASAAGAVWFFWNLPQARDLFAEIRSTPLATGFFWFLFYLEIAGLWLLPVYVGARLALACRRDRIGIAHESPHRWIETFLPPAMVAVGVVGVALGVFLARHYLIDSPNEIISAAARRLFSRVHAFAAVLAILAIPLVLWCLSQTWRLMSRAPHDGQRLVASIADRFQVWSRAILTYLSNDRDGVNTRPADQKVVAALTAVTALSTLFIVALAADPGAIAAAFPRALLLPILLGIWVAPLTVVGVLSHRWRLPLILILFGLSIAVDSLIDNHHVGQSVQSPMVTKRIALKRAYLNWQAANGCDPDKSAANVRCPKPIIVAAAGGASRAAFFTGSVLGLLTDITNDNPTEFNKFTDQLFGISAVSGSSLAATSFVALHEVAGLPAVDLTRLRASAEADALWYGAGSLRTPYGMAWKDAMQILLAGDFLTPVATAALRDTTPLGLFLPDRAEILAGTWTQRIEMLGAPKNPFLSPLTSFAPTEHRWRPILYLNGSMVENGRRIIASPVAPSTPPYPHRIDCDPERLTEFYADAYDFHDLFNGHTTAKERRRDEDERIITRDVTLGTSSLLSARFPIISPHGTIQNAAGETVAHIVDGGYFENFGALTVADIINGLRIIHTNLDPTAGRLKPCAAADKRPAASPPAISKQAGEPTDDEDEDVDESERHDCDWQDHRCLKLSQPLRPMIIQISNDPGTQPCLLDADDEVDSAERIDLPVLERWALYPSLSYIVEAVLGARIGRGTHATELLSYILDDDRVGYFAAYDIPDPGYAHFRVCLSEEGKNASRSGKGLRFRDVSMSWWLSKPVQAFLDDELCNKNNRRALTRTLMALRKDRRDLSEDEARALSDRYRKQFVDARCESLKTDNIDRSQKGIPQ
jgi:hypothetical protein